MEEVQLRWKLRRIVKRIGLENAGQTEESGGFATEMAREATAPEFLTVLMSISLAFNTKEREI